MSGLAIPSAGNCIGCGFEPGHVVAVKASSGKEAGAIYAVIESVGKSGVTPVCEGKEFKLEHIQEECKSQKQTAKTRAFFVIDIQKWDETVKGIHSREESGDRNRKGKTKEGAD